MLLLRKCPRDPVFIYERIAFRKLTLRLGFRISIAFQECQGSRMNIHFD
jgi:hypothetical protein